jgi:hypothetical protein
MTLLPSLIHSIYLTTFLFGGWLLVGGGIHTLLSFLVFFHAIKAVLEQL